MTQHPAASGKFAIHNPFKVFFLQLFEGGPTEVFAVFLAVLYALVFVWFGVKRLGERRRWFLQSVRRVLTQEFALVEQAEPDSFSETVIYCSGRQNCKSCTLTLTVPNRHDLFSLLLLAFSGAGEAVRIKIDFLETDAVLPLVYALCRRGRVMERFLLENEDVRIFGREEVELPQGAHEFVVRTENKECDPVPPAVLRTLMEHGDLLHFLHISDQINLKQLDVAERAIVLQFTLPRGNGEGGAQSLERLIKAMCDLTDHVQTFGGSLFPSFQSRQVALDARARVRAVKENKKNM